MGAGDEVRLRHSKGGAHLQQPTPRPRRLEASGCRCERVRCVRNAASSRGPDSQLPRSGFVQPLAQHSWVLYTDCAQTCSRGGATVYCDESQNPSNAADVSVSGTSLGAGVTVDLSSGPPGQFCYLLVSDDNGTVSQPPGAKGDLCLVPGPIGRYVKDTAQIDALGTFTTDIGLSKRLNETASR